MILSTEYKIDATVFAWDPLVAENADEEYRVYLPPNRNDARVTEIGRSGWPGYLLVDGAVVRPGAELPSGTRVNVEEYPIFKRVTILFPKSSGISRVGVFYSTIQRGTLSVSIPIIKMLETGKNNNQNI